MSPVTAALAAPRTQSQWQWEVSVDGSPVTTVVPLSVDPRRLVPEMGEIDRYHHNSAHNLAVHGRGVIVERFLDRVWHTLVQPLVAALPGPVPLRLEVPPALVRLPLTTARSAASGESLIHVCEPVVCWPAGPVRAGHPCTSETAARATTRFDGHLADVAHALLTQPPSGGVTVLLLGCRTAALIPWLPAIGSPRALVTSWDVDDGHCGTLGDMIENGLATGLTLAAAVRSTQARLSGRHPYEWAGYSVVEMTASARGGAVVAAP